MLSWIFGITKNILSQKPASDVSISQLNKFYVFRFCRINTVLNRIPYCHIHICYLYDLSHDMELSSDYKIDKDSVLESKIFEDKKIMLAQERKEKETTWSLHTVC